MPHLYNTQFRDPALVQRQFEASRPIGRLSITLPRVLCSRGRALAGTIYTTGTKVEEHGGFQGTDTHVGLLVSNPAMKQSYHQHRVETRQVRPPSVLTMIKDRGVQSPRFNCHTPR